jgi:hypothetical protein
MPTIVVEPEIVRGDGSGAMQSMNKSVIDSVKSPQSL